MWEGIVSQAGAAAPTTDQLLRNDFAEALTWTRSAAGEYQLNSASSLFIAKTGVTPTPGSVHCFLHGHRDTAALVQIHSVSPASGLHADDLLASATIRVEMFP